jgi:hypothetical protein
MHFRTSSIQDIYKLSQEKWLSIIEKKTVLPTPYIRLFKDGMYDGRRYFPSCNDETEVEIGTGKNARVGNSTAKQMEEMDTTPDNTQVSNLQESPCTQPTNACMHACMQLDKLQKVLTNYILRLFSQQKTVVLPVRK